MSQKLDNPKHIYFASDLHLGTPNYEESLSREKEFVLWLSSIQADCKSLFLVGDIFDFWFDYKTAIPKGYVRVLGKLAELADQGVEIHFFAGNHDFWTRDYFQKELSIPVFHKPQEFDINGKLFLIGHGDGLGPGDHGYKRMKKVFTFPFFKWLFRWLHPDIGVRLGHYFSVKNKLISGDKDARFLGEENEWLALYCRKKLQEKHYDFFVFGHRHLPLEIELNNSSTYINLGDWIQYYTYGEFMKTFKLKEF